MIDGYEHFNVTVLGPDDRFDIHHEIVIAKTREDAIAAALSAVKQRHEYRRVRVGGDVFAIVPHPAYPATIHADDFVPTE